MNQGIGPEKTREDHAGVASQLYAAYAEGMDLRNLVVVVGEDALTERDKKYLRFADAFEKRFVSQPRNENRPIEDSLALGWDLLSMIPAEDLKRVKPDHVKKYLKPQGAAVQEKPAAEKEPKPAAEKEAKPAAVQGKPAAGKGAKPARK
jgi:vacuolar-type H+-ATPase subunit B/Vma2